MPVKYKNIIAVIVFTLSAVFAPLGTVYAAISCPDANPCRPYIKFFGADAFTGGAYLWTNNSCSDIKSQSNLYQDNSGKGGILTFTKSSGTTPNISSNGGSGSQYGVISLGEIKGPAVSSEPLGFYSGGVLANGGQVDDVNLLTFKNTGYPDSLNAVWGGSFAGATPFQPNCISDAFNDNKSGATSVGNFNIATDQVPGDIIKKITTSDNSPSSVKALGGGTINASSNLTYFVNGDIAITGNITYGAHDATNVPKFTLVALGNIYIAPTVTQLDGLYVAEPDYQNNPTAGVLPGNHGGVIWDCNDVNHGFTAYSRYVNQNCYRPLVFNGAIIAMEVNFVRINGAVVSASTAEEQNSNLNTTLSNCQKALPSCTIAEIVNYTPEMVIGDSFFGGGGSTPTPPRVDSLRSLPPVF